uniref:Centromere protein M n=1 Tax=Falco tinnunculus TaxID=100819 RepID=A0A8C4XMW1_FALTI
MSVVQPFDKLPIPNSAACLVGPPPRPRRRFCLPGPGPAATPACPAPSAAAGRAPAATAVTAAAPRRGIGRLAAICKRWRGAGPRPWPLPPAGPGPRGCPSDRAFPSCRRSWWGRTRACSRGWRRRSSWRRRASRSVFGRVNSCSVEISAVWKLGEAYCSPVLFCELELEGIRVATAQRLLRMLQICAGHITGVSALSFGLLMRNSDDN